MPGTAGRPAETSAPPAGADEGECRQASG